MLAALEFLCLKIKIFACGAFLFVFEKVFFCDALCFWFEILSAQLGYDTVFRNCFVLSESVEYLSGLWEEISRIRDQTSGALTEGILTKKCNIVSPNSPDKLSNRKAYP